jgi:hypothetical protein
VIDVIAVVVDGGEYYGQHRGFKQYLCPSHMALLS